jgi:hypothetical protein
MQRLKRSTLMICFLALLLVSCNFPLLGGKTTPAQTASEDAQANLPGEFENPTTTELPYAMDSMDSSEPFQLAIITPAEFADALQPLADFKNKTGMPARVITLEEIYAKCSGRDQAEQVKTCLAQLAAVNKIHFAMLVGDMDKFPVRFTKADRDAPEAGYTAFFPTDLYYADLFKSDGSFDNWDANQNGYYGEICGEITTCPLNSDNVDLYPDIAVGRIPVSNEKELQIYINKVITYESTAANSDWANKVLMIGTNSFVQDSCRQLEDMASYFPAKYQPIRMYEESSFCTTDVVPSTQAILDTINNGVGFVTYIGHGDNSMWVDYLTIKDLFGLTNASSPAIIFSTACGTSEFGPRPPADPYMDVNGVMHIGNDAGEVFSDVPPPPANIQTDYIDGFGEIITVQIEGGAVAYVGAITGSQQYGLDLNYYFFQGLSVGKPTVGDMWMYMVQTYYQKNTFPVNVDPPDWTVLARFHQAWKFMLFGDPSLRVGGVVGN